MPHCGLVTLHKWCDLVRKWQGNQTYFTCWAFSVPFTKSPKSKPRNKVLRLKRRWTVRSLVSSPVVEMICTLYNQLSLGWSLHLSHGTKPSFWVSNDAMTRYHLVSIFSSWPFPSLFLEPWQKWLKRWNMPTNCEKQLQGVSLDNELSTDETSDRNAADGWRCGLLHREVRPTWAYIFEYGSWPSNALLLAVVPNATFSFQENLCLTGKLPFLGGLLRFHRTPEKSAANLCFESYFPSKKQNENCCMIHIVLVIAVAFFQVVLSIQRRLAEIHYQT